MSLTCPRCSVAMTEHSAATESGTAVIVDLCGQCGGLWLDAQKLAVVCPTVADLPARKTEILLTGTPGTNIAVCPRCESVPYEFTLMEGMQVDFCPRCSGVWLDGDEYQEGAFVPVQRDTESSPYRSRGADPQKARQIACELCATPVTVATSFVWEQGFLCRACFAVRQQRAQARRVEDASGMIDLRDVVGWVLDALTYSRRR